MLLLTASFSQLNNINQCPLNPEHGEMYKYHHREYMDSSYEEKYPLWNQIKLFTLTPPIFYKGLTEGIPLFFDILYETISDDDFDQPEPQT